MNIYYQNETLYVNNFNEINDDKFRTFKKRLFRIIKDYGIKNIIITFNEVDSETIRTFKKDLVKVYHGHLLIKKN